MRHRWPDIEQLQPVLDGFQSEMNRASFGTIHTRLVAMGFRSVTDHPRPVLYNARSLPVRNRPGIGHFRSGMHRFQSGMHRFRSFAARTRPELVRR